MRLVSNVPNTAVMQLQLSSYKKHKRMEKQEYDEWRNSVLESNKQSKTKGIICIYVCLYICVCVCVKSSFFILYHNISTRWGWPTLAIFYILLSVACKRTTQTRLNFLKESSETQKLEAIWKIFTSSFIYYCLARYWFCWKLKWGLE